MVMAIMRARMTGPAGRKRGGGTLGPANGPIGGSGGGEDPACHDAETLRTPSRTFRAYVRSPEGENRGTRDRRASDWSLHVDHRMWRSAYVGALELSFTVYTEGMRGDRSSARLSVDDFRRRCINVTHPLTSVFHPRG